MFTYLIIVAIANLYLVAVILLLKIWLERKWFCLKKKKKYKYLYSPKIKCNASIIFLISVILNTYFSYAVALMRAHLPSAKEGLKE